MTTGLDTTIAAILASEQVDGEVSFTGAITAVDRSPASGGLWAEVTVVDASGEAIPVLVFPRLYAHVHRLLVEGTDIRVAGRLNQTPTRLEIYASNIQPNPDLPDWEH